MSRVNTYLNFAGQTEEAFARYADIFGTTVTSLMRFSEAPGMPEMPEAVAGKVVNAQLPILAGHVLMATDVLEELGQTLRVGNNTTISLEVDSKDEADRLYAALSEGGDPSQANPMTPMFFGYWGTTLDRFGVRWMINFVE